MILSYAGRLLCVAAFMTGLIHLFVEGLLWAMAPFVLRIADALSARQRERLLYALQLVPVFAAVLLTCAVCVPQYVRSEMNHEPEAVGWVCLSGAVAVGLWYGFTLIRGLAVAARTFSFVRLCRRESSEVSFDRMGTPIMSYPGKAYSIALVGLFHPFILISDSLLGEGGLSRIAIDIVLDHEVSHAKQLDNWKLFSLYCLPGLRLTLRNGRTWTQMWQGAAEWAADDDAVRCDSSRVLLLAETLVAVARRAAQHPQLVCMGLACGEADLAARVGRLIDGPKDAAASREWSRVGRLAVGLVGLVGTLAAVLLSSRVLLERVIHLGQG